MPSTRRLARHRAGAVWTVLRAAPMRDRDAPLACPQCDATSSRGIFTAPSLGALPAQRRRAHEANERAAHEPKRLTASTVRKAPDEPPRLRSAGCSRPSMIGH